VSVQQATRGKERELRELIPQWENARTKESAEKRKMEEARTQLNALFAKQGRVNRFRTKAERDAYLKQEIASIEAYQRARSAALDSTRKDATQKTQDVTEMGRRVDSIQGSLEDGRTRVKDIGEQVTALKEQQTELIERRKELWREDTKLDGLLAHASDELRAAERNLAGMMDKVSICAPSIDESSFIVLGYWLWSPRRR
jgi:structural maintenance of chromosome 3 (chondroitin sulfate proteoglycan 6)